MLSRQENYQELTTRPRFFNIIPYFNRNKLDCLKKLFCNCRERERERDRERERKPCIQIMGTLEFQPADSARFKRMFYYLNCSKSD
jgi:Glu-tRNA(Gln) amidotransferase subunit E-like FAD-binding protein